MRKMKINEIFYSHQGEGRFAGTPAIFIRFSGCNLKCPFCDTQHQDGKQMSEDEIIALVKSYPSKLVVITGGEPSLFLTEEFVDKLHEAGKYIAVESNGTKKLPDNVDWVTISPKDEFCKSAEVVEQRINELKVVYDFQPLERYFAVKANNYYLQPCDKGNKQENQRIIEAVVNESLKDPRWKISLQLQKILNVR